MENIMKLSETHKRFERVSEKVYWEKLRKLLLSDNKENIIQGMNLVETLDEELYYDGICTFLEDDGKGNWLLKEGLKSENALVLKMKILRIAEENVGHETKEVFEKVFFGRDLCESVDILSMES